GAALDGPLDVVVGHRALLGLLDGVVQRRVAGRVTAAVAGGNLNVLDQLGEHLAAFGVQGGLLVLGRRPFTVAAHLRPFPRPSRGVTSTSELSGRSVRPLDTPNQVAEQAVHPPVAGQLGMERGSEHHPLPNRDDPTLGRRGTGSARPRLARRWLTWP